MNALLHAMRALDAAQLPHPGRSGLLESPPPVGGGTVRVSGTFNTRDEAETAMRAYLRDYMPEGYGTTFWPIKIVRGLFVVYAERSDSCE